MTPGARGFLGGAESSKPSLEVFLFFLELVSQTPLLMTLINGGCVPVK